MNCPNCNQIQSSDESFCRRCGAVIGVARVSAPHMNGQNITPKGVKQGVAILLFGLVLVTVLAILRNFISVPQALVEIAILVFCLGGIIRMCYSYFFNTKSSLEPTHNSLPFTPTTQKLSENINAHETLPEADIYMPPVDLKKFDTAQLVQPSSISEYTTKSLKDRREQ